MTTFISNHKKALLILFFITILYFLIRLPSLTLQPIFADEAIYIRWAQVMKAEATLRFLPLTDGKTPLYMWLLMPVLKFVPDPLLAGRLLSVFSGYLTLLGVLFLGWRFFNKRIGIIAAFLCAITPFIFFFDRMALVDSLLAAFSIWIINAMLLLITNPRLDLAMGLGLFLGGGIITKTPGLFNFLTLPVSLIVYKNWKKNRQSRLLKIVGLWGVAVAIGMVIYNMLRLGPGFSNLSSRNQDYVLSPMRILEKPWDPFIFRVRDLSEFLFSLYGLPLIVMLLLGVFLILKNRNKYGITLLVWSLIPLLIVMASLKTLTARYILFMVVPWLVIASYGVERVLESKHIKRFSTLGVGSILIVLSLWPLYFWGTLITDPEKAPLASMERRGYLEDWTAGYGLREIAADFQQESQGHSIVVGTEGIFGTLPDGIQIYFDKNPNVTFIGDKAEVTSQLRNASLKTKTYFIVNKSREKIGQENVTLVKEYPRAQAKDGSRDAILLFEVKPLVQTASSSAMQN